jgi:hypothetical protein
VIFFAIDYSLMAAAAAVPDLRGAVSWRLAAAIPSHALSSPSRNRER